VDGATYLDFAGGRRVMNVGYSDPAVIAIQAQVERYTHTCAHVVMPPYIAPAKHPKKRLLVNSGAEAVENAIKIARQRRALRAAGSVWTSNVQRAMRMSSALEFGAVWVNEHLPITAEMPHSVASRREASARICRFMRSTITRRSST
jgi:hypothetical protein